ncbi:RNA methyltransferase, RsmE family [Lentimicrobium saccharophilum]|uniref:Ribosomal RNA small subunit methyltransferase E n=1 Tax=Lentimicrobium saccharophilum TaxID=1678841 RepID=A0A0S7BQ27_9BACT|nr:RsmE family RNA methyltransferase [Lentimicrobium saccharophilum]GAP42837.1 RNA methyltransferase, RsmE family [Lentimicrobium saccharophilum]
MHLFYLPGKNLGEVYRNGEVLQELPADEAGHLRVMRLKTGERLRLTDGLGNFAEAILEDPGPKKFTVRITGITPEDPRSFRLIMAVAPTKNIARFEWFIEKATEFGVDEIIPVWCEHSERTKLRTDRLQKVAVAAMKQSLKATLPLIHEPVSLQQLFKRPEAADHRFIAWIDDQVTLHLKDSCQPRKDTLVLIGPEGDFSKQEVQQAVQADFRPVSLGKARLRTETAALTACFIVNLINT